MEGASMNRSIVRTISLPVDLDERIKEACERHGYTRSEFIREAVRRFLTELWERELEGLRRKAEAEGGVVAEREEEAERALKS